MPAAVRMRTSFPRGTLDGMSSRRARLRRLAGAVLAAAALAVPGAAAAQAFHTLKPPAIPAMPIYDIVVRGGTGWAVAWQTGATTATVYPVTFPTNAPPSVTLTGADVQTLTTSTAPDLAYDGTVVLVVGSGSSALRRSATGTWAPASLAGLFPRRVALDPSGQTTTGIVTANPVGGNVGTSTNEGANWTATTVLTSSSSYDAVAVWGLNVVIVPSTQSQVLYGSGDDGSTWGPLQASATGLSGADVVATPNGFIVAGPAGAFFTTPDGVTNVTNGTDTGGPDFVRVGYDGTSAWVLTSTGGLFDVNPASPSWPASAPFTTPVPSPLGLTVDGTNQILVTGTDGTGAAILAWRNRPPVVTTGPSPVTLTEGGPAVPVTVTGMDPDGDTITSAWSCPGLAAATFAPGSGLGAQLTVPDDPTFCPAQAPRTYTCQVVLSDPEPRSSSPATFSLTVKAADTTAPTFPTPTLAPGTKVLPGTAMTATASPTDACGIASIEWVVQDASGNPVSGYTHTGATYAFAAPPLVGAKTTDYDLVAKATDPSGNVTPADVAFQVIPPAPAITVACPTSLPAGQTTTVTATPTSASGPITSVAWTPAPPGQGEVATKVTGQTLEVTPDACAPAETVDITATATGPGGTSQVVTCAAVPVVPAPHAPTVDVPKSVSVTLGPSGGQATLTATVGTACAGATLSLAWDLSGIPAAARAASPPTGGPPGAYPLPIKVAAADVTSVLGGGVSRKGTIGLTVTDSAGGTPVTKTIPVTFTAALKIAVDLSIPGRRSVSPGDLVLVRATVHPNLRVPLGDLIIEMSDLGLDPVYGRAEVASGSCAGGRPDIVPDTNDGPALELNGAGNGCDPTVEFLARRGFGPAVLEVDRCVWPTGWPAAPCTASVKLHRSSVIGCSAAGGPPGWGSLLVLLALVALRRRRGAG